jgi:hypothetical protein
MAIHCRAVINSICGTSILKRHADFSFSFISVLDAKTCEYLEQLSSSKEVDIISFNFIFINDVPSGLLGLGGTFLVLELLALEHVDELFLSLLTTKDWHH